MGKKLRLFFVLTAISLTTSCIVDKELDLNKGLDPAVTVIPGMKVIFGDTGTVHTDVILNSIVKAGQAVSWINMVAFDYNGNLCFSTGSKILKNAPLVGSEILGEKMMVTTLSLPSSSISEKITLSLAGNPEIAEGAEAIKNIKTNPFTFDLTLSLPPEAETSFLFKKGFRITLPGFLSIHSIHEDSPFAADGEHELTATKDFSLLPGESFNVGIDITAFAEGPFKKGDAINLSGDLLFSGQVTTSPKEGSSAGSTLSCNLVCKTGKATLSEAEVLVSGSIPCGDIDTYPAVINYAKPYVGLSDLELVLKAENRMSVQLDLDARLRGEGELGEPLCDYPVGAHEGAEPVLIEANEEDAWLFAGKMRYVEFTPYILPGLENIVRGSNASHFGFKDIRVTPKESSWQRVSSDCGEGLFKGSAQFFMPFMVGKGSKSAVGFKLGHFQVDTTMTLDKFTPIIFEMDVENTTPLSFRFAAEIVDREGNVISQYKPVVDGTVKGGSIATPGESVMKIGFTTRDIVPFDAIKLTFTIDSDSDSGTPLNRNQGITFRRLRIVMPEGLTFDPAWLKYIQHVIAVKQAVGDVVELVESI